MPATERFGFRQARIGFAQLSEQEPNAEPGLARGAAHKPVVTHARKALRQDVQQPAPDELSWMQAHDGGRAGGAGSPAQQDVAIRIVTEQTLWMERAALDVSGEVTQGGSSPAHRLELDVPPGGGRKGA